MPDLGPDIPRTTETRTTYSPSGSTTTEVRAASPNRTAWWVVGLVVIVAIVAFAIVYSRQSPPAANDQALATASQAASQDAQNAAALAQSNAQAAQTAAQISASAAGSSARSAAAGADQPRQTQSPAAADTPPSSNPPQD